MEGRGRRQGGERRWKQDGDGGDEGDDDGGGDDDGSDVDVGGDELHQMKAMMMVVVTVMI